MEHNDMTIPCGYSIIIAIRMNGVHENPSYPVNTLILSAPTNLIVGGVLDWAKPDFREGF